MAFENWPYSNFHDLNLDWILQQIKELGIKVDNVGAEIPHISEYNGGVWDSQHAYSKNEIVFDANSIFVAIRDVPAGILITNTLYWTEIADLSFDPSAIDAALARLDERCDAIEEDIYYVTPEDYGAVRDGLTDCAAAFTAALNSGKVVKLLQGNNGYLIKTPVVVTKDTAKLIGPDNVWNNITGNISGITLTENGYFQINAEYFQAEHVYFYSYNRSQGSTSAITINAADGLNGDAAIKHCVFSSCDNSIVCNARGLDVEDCLFARGTPAITLNYRGVTNNPTPITESTITGGRAFSINNCRFHTGVTWSVLVPATATVYNLNFEDNLSDHSYGEMVIYGSVENANISGNTWTLCNRPVLAVADGKFKNSVFNNNVCSANAANALPDNYISLTGSNCEIENVQINNNVFKTSAYRAILATGTSVFNRVTISNNTFDDLNITGDNITYGAISLPATFNAVAIVGNVFGSVAPTAAGCCIRSDTEASSGSLNMLVVAGNIKYYDKDYLVHGTLQAQAVNSDIQTYRLNP